MKIYCKICRKITEYYWVGKIEERPLVVLECSECFELDIQTKETYDLVKRLET